MISRHAWAPLTLGGDLAGRRRPGRVLIIQHGPADIPGPLTGMLTARGLSAEVFEVHAGIRPPRWPDPAAYAAVISLGAPWSVIGDPASAPWIGDEIALLATAARTGPVLGVCFGAQAIAVALGGQVGRSPLAEIGWRQVISADPGLVPPGQWMQWHYDAVTVLPPAAMPVAVSKTPAGERIIQAFAVPVTGAERRWLAGGVQFHPEADPEVVGSWLDHGGRAELEVAGLDPARLEADTRELAPGSLTRAGLLLDAWLAPVLARL